MQNFLANKPLLRGLLSQADQWHTINGGVAELYYDEEIAEDGLYIYAKVPGVHPEAYQVAIKGSLLFLQVHLSSSLEFGAPGLHIPMHHRVVDLPAGVDVTRIDAVYDEEGLRVFLPFVDNWSDEVQNIHIRVED